ncbi:MAG: TonB-dependent receptor [Bacteroidetes bacterium]|nr:TonB-dependent receptor [Bacteroidota bacterium]
MDFQFDINEKMKRYFLIIFLITAHLSYAQNNRQKIRGVIVDKLSQTTLPGATVQIMNEVEKRGAVTNEKGTYVIPDVLPGRYELKISYVGYKDVFVSSVVVTSGKETILDIAMEEDVKSLNEVVITANSKDKTINSLSTISGRTFSMEEVNRFAGGRSDPARLAANFAGVSATDDSRNDIVIRGNSPVGVLWRIDGMDATNPNHFASVGTTGGAVSALNTNMLKSSDFFTSAWPAEYGNAISGVFDIGFRNGNTQKRETTVQLGLTTGLEAMTEGPISRSNGSSYLIGYRYSLAGIAQAMGVNIGTTATPTYQDLSFKINSGETKLGRFSLFGILANSSISIEGGSSNELYGGGQSTDFRSKIAIGGLKHFKQITGKSYISSTIGINYSGTNQLNYGMDSLRNSYSKEENKVARTGYEFITNYNLKINSRLFFKAGMQAEYMNLYLYNKIRRREGEEWSQIWDYNSYTTLAQVYAHLKYNISEKLTLNAGLHAQQFFLNNSFSLEPRLGLKYELNNRNSFSFGYGLHSQTQPLNIYFLQTPNADGSYNYDNLELGFTKSNHFVLGYDVQPFKDWRLKIEAYYQHLINVPVNTYPSSYSMLNTGASFNTDLEDSLANTGTGRNYGVELTVEKFFSRGYYGLFTASLYQSKYTASDGTERNTAFNGRYVANFLAGKEWKPGKEKRNAITTDIKVTYAGGRYFTPIDLTASQARGREVLKGDEYAYTSTYPDYFRMDFKIGFTLNSRTKKLSQSISLDMQNVTNNKNVFSQSYDDRSKSVSTTYQLGFFPNFIYKIQF